MGTLDCCHHGIKRELVIEADPEHIQDNDGFPQDTDPAFRSKKIESDIPIENINENGEEAENQENNNYVIEVPVSDVKENNQQKEEIQNYENYENVENNNMEMNAPQVEMGLEQEGNAEINAEINDYNQQITNNNEIVENVQDSNVQNELNIDQILSNYNQQQNQQSQNVENAEDYNKYFENIPSQQNDFDINQYLNSNNDNNQVNLNDFGDLNTAFTFADNQNINVDNLISSSNIQTSQEYNYEYNFNDQNVQNA